MHITRHTQQKPGSLKQILKGHCRQAGILTWLACSKSGDKPVATREASNRIMNTIAGKVHALTGGSADLAPSVKTNLKDQGDYDCKNYCGRNIHFGVREHAMDLSATVWRSIKVLFPIPARSSFLPITCVRPYGWQH